MIESPVASVLAIYNTKEGYIDYIKIQSFFESEQISNFI